MKAETRLKQALIDLDTPMDFHFNGKLYHGYKGDTLASALLANGVNFVGRSFKYHRARGIFSAGSEEPNALVSLREGAWQEPNVKATTAELYHGLVAKSQNHLGSLDFDLLAVNDLLSPVLTAGFYYKTFMWPAVFWEKLYEPLIRRAAGLGVLPRLADPDTYDKGFLHCDLLVVGAGPSGLMAALTAARAGLRVILADEDFRTGGRLNAENHEINNQSAMAWATTVVEELKSLENLRLMTRTTVYGAYDHGIYGAVERVSDHLQEAEGQIRQTLWRIYSKRCILAAGSLERSIVFGNNDRPGIMLAGAVRAYANRWGVATGQRLSIFTNNASGWQAARELLQKGIDVTAIIDSRDELGQHDSENKIPGNVEIFTGTSVVDTRGRKGLKSIRLSNGTMLKTDCLAVSGGWSPAVHLTCHQRGRPQWQEAIAGFIPGMELPVGMSVVGAANGKMTLAKCLHEGHVEAESVVESLGRAPVKATLPMAADEEFATSCFWYVKESKNRAWIDLQNDVTLKDIKLSHQEGFRSIEHLKRYTTLGMATDQGKTSNIPALAIMAEIEGKTIAEVGTTIFRPPYNTVSFGALAGRSKDENFRPERLPPSHHWAEEQGAVFVEAGLWLRAQWYPRPGETHWRQSVDREATAVRRSVGICDVSTLGKIDIQGKDAVRLLEYVYANGFAKLAVGKTRYGIMLREDGMVMDDGTTAHLAENHFLMTTTTANAGAVFRHMEFCKQCLWPELDVHMISVTDQFAQYAVAGPRSRKLLQKIIDPGFDISNEAFPFMSCGEITICNGIQARLFRISFSGELAYEIAVPARYGDSLIRILMAAGEEFDVTAYGVEALNVLRIEKGHVTVSELNGQISAENVGMGRMLSGKKDYIGNVLSQREKLTGDGVVSLVGLKPLEAAAELKAGAHFIPIGKNNIAENDHGWMTSVAYSPHQKSHIGLGFITDGNKRIGEHIRAVDLLSRSEVLVQICSPHFVDPKGERVRG